MAVAHVMKPGLTDKSRVKILTVDPTTRRIEAALKDGSMIHIAVWDLPNAFRWPVEGEIWIVRRDNGIWMLDHRAQEGRVTNSTIVDQEPFPVTVMAPGQMRLDATAIFDADGHQLATNGLTWTALTLSTGWSPNTNCPPHFAVDSRSGLILLAGEAVATSVDWSVGSTLTTHLPTGSDGNSWPVATIATIPNLYAGGPTCLPVALRYQPTLGKLFIEFGGLPLGTPNPVALNVSLGGLFLVPGI